MPKLKPGTKNPTAQESTAIDAAIASDPDTREMTDVDFARATVGAAQPNIGKTRITMWVDNDVLDAFKARGAQAGKGYQTLANEALRASASADAVPVTVDVLRRILREELHHA